MRRVVFRADGSELIGYGHFIRTLAIAGIINKRYDCAFACRNPTPYQRHEVANVCRELIPLTSEDHRSEFLARLQGQEIVVLDDYGFDSDFQQKIRDKGCQVVYIDDMNEKFFVCDALINNIPGFTAGSFRKADHTRLYLGTDYAPLRKEFFDPSWRHKEKQPNEVFLAFGGGDSFNISEKIVRYLSVFNPQLHLNVLIGDAYRHRASLERFESVSIFRNLSAASVAELISKSTICVVTASSFVNEVSSIGCKMIIGYVAENQIAPYRYFTKNGLAIGVEDYRDVTEELFNKKFTEAMKASYLEDNQKERYHYQQQENIVKIFDTLDLEK